MSFTTLGISCYGQWSCFGSKLNIMIYLLALETKAKVNSKVYAKIDIYLTMSTSITRLSRRFQCAIVRDINDVYIHDCVCSFRSRKSKVLMWSLSKWSPLRKLHFLQIVSAIFLEEYFEISRAIENMLEGGGKKLQFHTWALTVWS